MIRAHKKLEVWKESLQLTKSIYEVSALLPSDEKFGLVSQLKRASVSVSANIAEGAARQTRKEFKQFLYISRGSLSEIDTLLELSDQLGFIKSEKKNELIDRLNSVSALLSGLIKSLHT